MSLPTTTPRDLPADAGEVLAAARSERAAADAAEARLLALAVQWVAIHPVLDEDDIATVVEAGRDLGVPVAGPGAPYVAEFAVAEFAAAVRLPTETGKRLLGEAVELAHRLPRVWARMHTGELPAWRARRIAQATVLLPGDGAAYVDRHVAPVAHRVRPVQLERLVDEAVARFEPDLALARARESADRRHVTVDRQQVAFEGTVDVTATLDLADAYDLDTAVTAGAAELAALGCNEDVGARRAMALGELARRQPTLVFDPQDGDTPAAGLRGRSAGRRMVLYVHLSEAAVTGADDRLHVARVERGSALVTAETVRAWCGSPGARITVTPVIDLAEHVRVDQWEVPDRIRERVVLRDGGCVFPRCGRPARRAAHEPGCDADHTWPHARGGPTCSCNIASLCRRHHRLKTHTAWRYHAVEPGTYHWASPHGLTFLVDHRGTTDLSPRPAPPHTERSTAVPPDE